LRRLGWSATFLFVICGAIRLARFNVQPGHIDKRYFVGLPIPAAAGTVAALVNLRPQRITDLRMTIVICLGLVLLGLLMVSTLRYRSFKDVDLRSRRSVAVVLLFALFFIAMTIHPKGTLALCAISYSLSGPLSRLYHAVTHKTHPADLAESGVQSAAKISG
jgi:CDP-diacylglycerol--serine O-phosphatidyltransferase